MNYKGVKDTVYICKQCGEGFQLKYWVKNLPSYCSSECQVEARWADTKQRIEAGESVWHHSQRRYLIETRSDGCEWCKITSWLDEPLVLQVDHIDGNPDNNFPSNLRLLCPNCHSLTPTYKGGNKNNPKMDKRSQLHRSIYKRNRDKVSN